MMGDRKQIQKFYLKDEAKAFQYFLDRFDTSQIDFKKANDIGKQFIDQIRLKGKNNIFDAFWQEYSLSSDEGVMLMSLAEAMLRTPDAQNQDALIIDKIDHENWKKHLGQSGSLLVNASTWGLFLTHKFLQLNIEQKQSFKDHLSHLSAKSSQPIIRTAVKKSMEVMGKQFVLGEDIRKALNKVQKKKGSGWRYSFDMLGEGARSEKDAQRYYQAYVDSLHHIGKQASLTCKVTKNHGVSVKISAIYPRFEHTQKEYALPRIISLLTELCLLAKTYNIGLNIDAEEADRLELSLDIIKALLQNKELQDWDGLGVVMQSYQKRCPFVIDWLYDVAKKNQKKIMVRLVKGAYWDSEIKHYQELGERNYPVWTRKETTDAAYLLCAQKLIEKSDILFPQFATHNASSVAHIIAMLEGKNIDYEFQCLYGMGEDLHQKIIDEHQIPSRIYAPVGTYEHLLSYLIRRLLENSANSSFVHLVSNRDIPVESLLQNPFEKLKENSQIANEKIILPKDIYGGNRINSKGFDLNDDDVLRQIDTSLKEPLMIKACPLLGSDEEAINYKKCYAPFDYKFMVGEKSYSSLSQVEKAHEVAINAFKEWKDTPLKVRQELLLKTADMIEENWLDYINLCVYEAGKTRKDAIAEIREAVDFCRYYAVEAENLNKVSEAIGVWVCISPWNFPLAIFMGQICAALVCGNTVIAKPAEQTSLIAYYTIEKMHQLGFPKQVLQLILGKGDIGAALTKLPNLAGVAFTGSTEVAKYIQKSLSRYSPYGALIAETGGQNVMIIDTTALAEQVVDDLIASSFQSAGQRCSSARILCVQKEALGSILALLQGAVKELKLSSPLKLSCDVGPIIDKQAQQKLQDYIDEKSKTFKLLYSLAPNEASQKGYFVSPTLFEIEDLSQLEAEQFGPILHILAYDIKDRGRLIDQIHRLGYGLTAGIHSRISYVRDDIVKRLKVGNIYVNRNQIGAIVGMQPFGGLGLSGTGPKAGGPHYLKRFTKIKTKKTDGLNYFFEEDHFAENSTNHEIFWKKEELKQVIIKWQSKVGLLNLAKEQQNIIDNYLSDLKNIWLPYFKKEHKLPAITGEENILTHHPKGYIVLDNSEPSLNCLLALMAALVSSNRVVTTSPLLLVWQEFLKIEDHLPCLYYENLTDNMKINGGLSPKKNIPDMVQKMSERKGEIVSVHDYESMIYEERGSLKLNIDMILRLTIEKTVSTDIARTVGNTELMSL